MRPVRRRAGEVGRRHEAVYRPASGWRLGADDLGGVEADERLVVKDEAVPALDRGAQAACHGELREGVVAVERVERVAVAARVLRAYMAVSACLRRVSESGASSGKRLTPIEALTKISTPETTNGARSVRRILRATTAAALRAYSGSSSLPFGSMSARRTRNSSPPCRATTSAVRGRARQPSCDRA
jgi:hypothetical protein